MVVREILLPKYSSRLLLGFITIGFPSVILGFVIVPIHTAMTIASMAAYFILHGFCRFLAYSFDMMNHLISLYESCKYKGFMKTK